MNDFQGYSIGLFLNNSSETVDPNTFSFTVSDNLYSPFPVLDLNFADYSGILLEFGGFTQGIPLNIKFGISGVHEILDVDFRSSCRDASKPTAGTPGLNGDLQINGLHDSYFKNRESPNKALKEMTVADAIKTLFPFEKNLKVEATKGKIESYAIDDPYKFAQEILLPQATNGKVKPYVFFRNLANELHFESISFLEDSAPSERLAFGDIIDGSNAYSTLNVFLPYNENLKKTLVNFNVMSKFLKNDLTFVSDNKSIATDVKDKIPVVVDTRIHHAQYFHRQFNPKVEYEQLNNAFCADAMRAGFFVDKAIVSLSPHPSLVAGKTVNVAVSILESEDKPKLSETFSSKWLIEQSYHSWDGVHKQGQTQLILCRSSMKPRRDSLIMTKAFSD